MALCISAVCCLPVRLRIICRSRFSAQQATSEPSVKKACLQRVMLQAGQINEQSAADRMLISS